VDERSIAELETMLGRTALVASLVGVLLAVPLSMLLPREGLAQSQRRTEDTDATRRSKQPGDDGRIAPSKPIDSDGKLQPPAREDDMPFSEWLSQDAYQQLFDRELKARRYPIVVEGRSVHGRREFRARFAPFPDGPFAFWSHHAVSEEYFDRRNRELTAQGARLISRQVVSDRAGRFAQGTWVRP
jgi:hypothetical protein